MCGCHSRSGRDGKEKNLPLAGLGPGLDGTFICEIIGSNVGRRIGYTQSVRGGGGGGVGGKWYDRPGQQSEYFK